MACKAFTALVSLLAIRPSEAFILPASWTHSCAPPTSTATSSSSGSSTALSMGLLTAKPIGIGSAAPDSRVTNVDLEAMMDTSDEWISTRTGISSRHVLRENEKISTLASTAAANALEMSGISGSEIDLIIVASSSPDDMFGDASTVAAAIGAKNAVGFDLTAACSGFLFALVTAGQFLHTGTYKKAVIVGADALSRWVDWDDRNTCILFGDGAGAMVLDSCDAAESGLLGFSLHSDGVRHQNLVLPYNGEGRDLCKGYSVSKGSYSPITMNGREVYKFATREVPVVLTEALDNAGMTTDQVDWLLLHQANIRIMESVAARMGIPMEKVITNLKEYGNTSAASIPLALDEAVRSGQVKKGDVIACAGFGAGLSWGAAIIKWTG